MDQKKFNLIQKKVWESNINKISKVENAIAVVGLNAALLAGEKLHSFKRLIRNSSCFRNAITKGGRQ